MILARGRGINGVFSVLLRPLVKGVEVLDSRPDVIEDQVIVLDSENLKIELVTVMLVSCVIITHLIRDALEICEPFVSLP